LYPDSKLTAMFKKLLVKTPVSHDGVNLTYDDKKQVIYKESILEVAAKKTLESLNSRLPVQLRAEITEIEVADSNVKSASNEDLKKKLDDLEEQKKNAAMQARIDQLENELADQKAAADKAAAEEAKKAAEAKAAEEADKVKNLDQNAKK
jgi:hypothetical protein